MDRHHDRIDPSNDSEAAKPIGSDRASPNWVQEVIAMTRPGVEIVFPARAIDEREIPFVYDDFR